VEQDRVYLHVGTRVRARKLGLNWRADSLTLSGLPRRFANLNLTKPRTVCASRATRSKRDVPNSDS
jgi:hypothetical protein